MSLERKDVRAKLTPEMHAALQVLCEVDDCDIGEFVERELIRVILNRVHIATLIAERTSRLGITGKSGAQPGTSGN